MHFLLAEGDEVKRLFLIAAFVFTPFISFFWASWAFITGWIGGWKMCMDEWE